jgi:hypothetical protein
MKDDFERFRRLVENDDGLTEELWGTGSARELAARVVQLANDRGLRIDPLDIEAAIADGQSAWLRRWED